MRQTYSVVGQILECHRRGQRDTTITVRQIRGLESKKSITKQTTQESQFGIAAGLVDPDQ